MSASDGILQETQSVAAVAERGAVASKVELVDIKKEKKIQ